jgi:hypothetical protein
MSFSRACVLKDLLKSGSLFGNGVVCILINVVVYEKVKDHATWLKAFNADAPNRKGSMGGAILQFDEDPNRHYIVFEFSDEGARDFVKFAKSPTMQKVFKDAGVLEQTVQLCSTTIKVDK